MSTKYSLEISVETTDAAVAAEKAGAQRIELCENLQVAGVTPGAELMREARERVKLPIFAMVRPREGDFVYSSAEFANMLRSLEMAKACGMDGAVLGILRSNGTVDVPRTRELVEAAHPLPVTFHRAFDETADVFASLEDVLRTGATRLLTSGGMANAGEGVAVLAKLVELAGEEIGILPGGGINPGNLEAVVRRTGAKEFHSGLGTVMAYGHNGHEEFEGEVRKLVDILAGM
jgi:copper homeostasis protein